MYRREPSRPWTGLKANPKKYNILFIIFNNIAQTYIIIIYNSLLHPFGVVGRRICVGVT